MPRAGEHFGGQATGIAGCAEQNDSTIRHGATLRQAYPGGMPGLEPPLLPDRTSDEEGGFDSLEDELRENVPPHHA